MFIKMTNSLKSVFLKNLRSSQLILPSNYCTKKLSPVADWNKPAKVSCILPERSGDRSAYQPLAKTHFINDFAEKSQELKDADESVKELFTFQLQPKLMEAKRARRLEVIKVQRHELDYGSHESKIAKMTVSIRLYQEYMERNPRNRVFKVILKELIERRKKYLNAVRRWDYKKFEWLLEKLDLEFKPNPPSTPVCRKDSIRRLSGIYCDRIRQDKLNDFKKELESKQLDFLENKVKTLEFIRNEQIECKVPVTITPDQIKEAKKQYKELKDRRAEEAEIMKKQSVKDDYELKLE